MDSSMRFGGRLVRGLWGELKQLEMCSRFNDESLRFLIGGARDRDRLYRAMNGVDIVDCAAALKLVPACEYNPIEVDQDQRRQCDLKGDGNQKR